MGECIARAPEPSRMTRRRPRREASFAYQYQAGTAYRAAVAHVASGRAYHRRSGPARAGRELRHRQAVCSAGRPPGGHPGGPDRHGRLPGRHPGGLPRAGLHHQPGPDQGGHLWWRYAGDGTSVCIGTVVEFVQYNVTTTKTWRVIVFTAQNPGGVTIASQTFTLGRGVYFWSFGVHRVFSGLSAVCLTASESFGMSCVHFPPSAG